MTAALLAIAMDLLVGLNGTSATPAWASFANPAFMRSLRLRLIGEILRNVREVAASDVRVYHLAAPSWRIHPDQLATFSPRRLREALRTELIRTGKLDELSGWLICFFHCDYDQRTGLLEPHFHIVVVGEKYRAIEALRTLNLFAGGDHGEIRRPIVCQAVNNPARQIPYLLKGYWQAIGSYVDATTGRPRRAPIKRRLPEPLGAQVLLFLHRQTFADMIWLHNIALVDGQFKPKEPVMLKVAQARQRIGKQPRHARPSRGRRGSRGSRP